MAVKDQVPQVKYVGTQPMSKPKKAVQHAPKPPDTGYDKPEAAVDLWRQNFRFTLRVGGNTYDIGPIVESVTWQDQSTDALLNCNSQAAMSGTLTMRKPALHQYDWLPAAFNAKAGHPGVMGAVIVCQVGYGGKFTPLWAMRVGTGGDSSAAAAAVSTSGSTDPTMATSSSASGGAGTAAEQVSLTDGSWALNLVDDLWILGSSIGDFKYTKGKKTRKKGWRCHEIAADVCAQFKCPVKQLAKGTAWLELPPMTLVSPTAVIAAAYAEETKRTGRTYVLRWGVPDAKYPLGALEVVPMQRNPNLLRFRDQLINAALTRSQAADFATVVEARGTLRDKKGKTKAVKYIATVAAAVQRYGYVRKVITFGNVESMGELQTLAKRSLAVRLTPIRTAELTHPGVATIRRGDAIRIDIPEEGYAQVNLGSLATPVSGAGLKAAEKKDPSLFGLPDSTVLPDLIPVDQPAALPRGAAAPTTGIWWEVRASAEDASSDPQNLGGWTELSSNGNGAATAGHTQSPNCMGGSVGACDFATLGKQYGHGTLMRISNPANGKSGTFPLTDIGNGSSFAPAIGLCPKLRSAIGWSDGQVVHIQLVNGDLNVVSGFGKQVGGPASPATSATAATSAATNAPKPDAMVPALLPIANQGIAFVTSVVHTVAAGSYTMNMVSSFIDILDPADVKAQLEKTTRDVKAAAAAAAKAAADAAAATAATTASTTTTGPSGSPVSGAIAGSPIAGQSPHASTHETSGLPGFPAYDYMAPAGTPALAPVDGKVAKLGGHPPSQGGSPGGPLGYSIYLSGSPGCYFMTHLDKVTVKVGDTVKQGQQMAEVANGPPSWSTPHCHMGTSHSACPAG